MQHIENISREDCINGNHFDCGDNSMLIQIKDPDEASMFKSQGYPHPKHKFKEVYQFEFFDCDREDHPIYGDFVISDEQAEKIVELLHHAINNKMQVVVHCHAGICRSGAIAEVGEIIGFNPSGNFRISNVLVKKKLLKALGVTYDSSSELKARYDQYEEDGFNGKMHL